MILVDSSVWVEGLRKDGNKGTKQVLGRMLESNMVTTCGPVRLEILGAARKNERKVLDLYFDNIPIIETDDTIWEEAIILSRAVLDKGFKIPWNDLLIAAISKKADIPVYTLDKHFQQIKKVNKIKLIFSL